MQALCHDKHKLFHPFDHFIHLFFLNLFILYFEPFLVFVHLYSTCLCHKGHVCLVYSSSRFDLLTGQRKLCHTQLDHISSCC